MPKKTGIIPSKTATRLAVAILQVAQHNYLADAWQLSLLPERHQDECKLRNAAHDVSQIVQFLQERLLL